MHHDTAAHQLKLNRIKPCSSLVWAGQLSTCRDRALLQQRLDMPMHENSMLQRDVMVMSGHR